MEEESLPLPPRRQDVLYILIGRLQNITGAGVSAPLTLQVLVTFYYDILRYILSFGAILGIHAVLERHSVKYFGDLL